jgi:phage shock protein C
VTEEPEERRMKKLYRSQKDKKIAGIFGGLGEIFSIDPTLLRLGFVFIGLATGVFPLLIAYLVGWVIIPKGEEPPKEPV